MAQRPNNKEIYRNRVRGLFHQAKERGFGVDDSVRAERLRTTLRSVILDARLIIPATGYKENLNWLYTQTEFAFRAPSYSIGQGLLYRNVYSPATSFRNELEWIASRLTNARETISRHLEAREKISILYLNGDHSELIECLDSVEKELGDSHWSISTRIAVLQTFEGIEAQKEFLAAIRKKSNSGLTAAFAFHTSVRNEPSVSFPWFESRLKKRNFSKRYPEHKIYLEHALLGIVPSAIDDVATVLRVEQSNTDVDVYETSISVAQALANRRLPKEVKESVEKYIKDLQAEISDPRLDKILFVLTGELPIDISHTDEVALNQLLTGSKISADGIDARKFSSDPASLVWSALALATTGNSVVECKVDTPLGLIKSQMTVVAGRMSGYEDARLSLIKCSLNVSGLSFARMLKSVGEALSAPCLNDLPEKLADAACASTSYGALEHLVRKRDGRASSLPFMTPSLRFIDEFYSTGRSDHLCDVANSICSFRMAIRSGTSDHLVKEIESVVANGGPFAKNWGWLAILELYCADNDLYSSLRLIGHWYSIAAEGDAPVPVDSALTAFKPKALSQCGHEITTSLALEAWRQASDSEAKRRYIRLAYNQFMAKMNIERPSLIPRRFIDEKPDLYITFLREICLPDIMDMSVGAKSSLSLQEERVAIYALLRQVDSENSSEYEDEILAITQSLSIWEGLKTIDSTRIHVEETAYAQAVLNELQGSFDRYASLVKAGVGVAPNFDEVLRNLQRDIEYTEGMSMPTNEADQLLGEMVRKMKEMFLKNSIYGLHGFLSRRIRHGSLIGHLRGPVERHALITQMSDATGTYSQNSHWPIQFTFNESASRLKVERAFSEFSRAFDRELLSMRDEKLQVKDDQHPNGIFDIALTSRLFAVIRSSIKNDLSLRSLITASTVSFWTLLIPSLKEAENLVKYKFQKKASELFNRLQTNVTPNIASDDVATKFAVAVRLAIEETQFQVRTVASWFDKKDDKSKRRTYTLFDAIEVGVKSAKAAISGFDPYIIKVCDNLNIPAVNLQFVADAVLVALSNIHKYSKTGNSPRVDINAAINCNGNALVLSVVSAVADGVKNPEAEKRLSQIRTNISNRSYERFVGTEGNTGFYKLAALVHQSDIGEIHFGFTESGGFELNITLSLILETAPNEEDSPHEEVTCE